MQMRRWAGILATVLLFAAPALSAKTVAITVGGTTTTGDPYYGYNTYPVLKFQPNNVTIDVGDTVEFSSLGGAAHNVHADDGSFRCANGCDGQGGDGTPSDTTWTSSVTFTKAGVFNFHCDQHEAMGMTGTITVNAPAVPIALGGYMSGNWYNANQAGHGFQLELSGTNDMIAIWFVYTPDGSGQNWVYAQGPFDPTSNTVTLPAQILTGAKFPPNFVPGDVHQMGGGLWGHVTFTFADCNNGTVSWHSDLAGYNGENDNPLAITRLTQIGGTTCPGP